MLTSTDKKSLEEIHKLFLSLEKTSGDSQFEKQSLDKLKKLIAALIQSENLDVARLAGVEKHLTTDMTLKHFVAYLLPFERLLNKNLQDDDFLVLTNDKTSTQQTTLPLICVLDNIRSAFNVGSIFRTAECLGLESVYLCGYTPLPDQWKLSKTAMGTQDYQDWKPFLKTAEALNTLKNKGYKLVALETSEVATDLYADFEQTPTAFILGNERFGLDPELLKLVDEIRVIPVRGRKNSLNVGVTAAIASAEWSRQYLAKQTTILEKK